MKKNTFLNFTIGPSFKNVAPDGTFFYYSISTATVISGIPAFKKVGLLAEDKSVPQNIIYPSKSVSYFYEQEILRSSY